MSERQFRSVYDKFHVVSESGSRYAPIYSPTIDPDGVLELEVIGKNDVYADIQLHAESVDINVIMARYQAGDADVLARVQGFYGDFSEMPKSLNGCLNSVIKAEAFFDTLPSSVKEKFDNDFGKFITSMDKPDFMDNFKVPSPEDPLDILQASDVAKIQDDDSESSPQPVD